MPKAHIEMKVGPNMKSSLRVRELAVGTCYRFSENGHVYVKIGNSIAINLNTLERVSDTSADDHRIPSRIFHKITIMVE